VSVSGECIGWVYRVGVSGGCIGWVYRVGLVVCVCVRGEVGGDVGEFGGVG
jgi:hypothetical protein